MDENYEQECESRAKGGSKIKTAKQPIVLGVYEHYSRFVNYKNSTAIDFITLSIRLVISNNHPFMTIDDCLVKIEEILNYFGI